MESSRSVSIPSMPLAPSPFLGYSVLEILQGPRSILILVREETPWGHKDDGLLVHLDSGQIFLL